MLLSKGWSSIPSEHNPDGLLQDDMMQFFAHLQGEERELYFDLAEEYTIIKDYTTSLAQLAIRFADIMDSSDDIIAAPVVKVDAPEQSGSGNAVLYEFRNQIERFTNVKVETIISPFLPPFASLHRKRFLIDDFIGSGNQCLRLLRELESRGVTVDGIISICTHEEGYSKLSNIVETYLDHKRIRKGLSLVNTFDDLSKRNAVNDGLEARIGVGRNYKRGYRGSEALLSLKRTPNNTLPAFWMTKEGAWPAPFNR